MAHQAYTIEITPHPMHYPTQCGGASLRTPDLLCVPASVWRKLEDIVARRGEARTSTCEVRMQELLREHNLSAAVEVTTRRGAWEVCFYDVLSGLPLTVIVVEYCP